MNPTVDCYSGFFDQRSTPTKLAHMLQKHSIQTHVIYGLALDACVKDTSFDARALGFEVFLVQDLCRSVHPAQENNTISEMRTHGIQVIDSMVLKRALEKIKR